METGIRIRAALKATLIHTSISIAVSASVAILVFGVWYPFPYRDLMGGFQLVGLIIAIDAVCGPFLTLLLYSPYKRRATLIFDLSVVGLLQLAALLYGLYIIAQARPVALVFEVDRFVVVSAAQVVGRVERQLTAINQVSWWGPKTLSVREPRNTQERINSLELSLQGVEPSALSTWWQPYESSLDSIQKRMKPLRNLYENRGNPDQTKIMTSLKELGLLLDLVYYLPLVTQKSLESCIVLLDRQGKILGFTFVNGFDD